MRTLATTLVLLTLLCTTALAAKLKPGDTLPDVEIKTPLKPAEAQSLGLSDGSRGFRFSQLKVQAIVVDLFSMYCPRCQIDAPTVNRVYERLKAQGGKLAFVGVGAGNSAFEVDVFRKKFQAPMPMLPDADFTLHKLFGAVGTPSYLVLKPLPGGKGFRVTFFLEGSFQDEETFLKQLLEAADLR